MCSISLVIKEMKIKTMMRYYYHTTTKVAKIKKSENTKSWQGHRGTEARIQC